MLLSFAVSAADDLLDNFTFHDKPTDITQSQAYALMEKNAAVIIDVRTPEEYAESHWPNAYNLPLDDLLNYKKELELLKKYDVPVVLYCRSGRRSGLAALKLGSLGYRRMMNGGGMITWPHETTSFYPVQTFEEAVKSVKPL